MILQKKLSQALNLFRCYKDKDIESFLRQKAEKYEKRNWCRVYLILNEDDFVKKSVVNVLGYYTLSPRSLFFFEEVSKTAIKRISGFKDRKFFEIVLIGHLGKYMERINDSTIISAPIDLNLILGYVLEVVNAIDQYLPCRLLLLECDEGVHKSGLYLNSEPSFTYLQKDGDLYQFFSILK